MHAVIMAGGRGTRLAPYTTVLPKPLMPLSDRPILDVLLRQLVRDGVRRVTISVSPLSGLIETWIRHPGNYGVPVDFVYEDAPLGTAGALRNVERSAEAFLALKGDVLTKLDFGRLIAQNRASGTIATMATKRRVVDIEYGVVHTDGDGRVAALEEKPRLPYLVSMGIYAMRSSIVDLIGGGRAHRFPGSSAKGHRGGSYRRHLRVRGLLARHRKPTRLQAAIAEFGASPEAFLERS